MLVRLPVLCYWLKLHFVRWSLNKNEVVFHLKKIEVVFYCQQIKKKQKKTKKIFHFHFIWGCLPYLFLGRLFRWCSIFYFFKVVFHFFRSSSIFSFFWRCLPFFHVIFHFFLCCLQFIFDVVFHFYFWGRLPFFLGCLPFLYFLMLSFSLGGRHSSYSNKIEVVFQFQFFVVDDWPLQQTDQKQEIKMCGYCRIGVEWSR